MNRRAFCFSVATAALVPTNDVLAATTTSVDARMSTLLDEFFTAALREAPELATSLGYDTGVRSALKARLHGGSLADVDRRRRIVAEQITALRGIDRGQLSPKAAIDYDAVLYDRMATDRANRRFTFGSEGAGAPYVISQLDGSYAQVPDFLDSQHTIGTASDCEAYLARLDAFAGLLDAEGERVRHDAGLGVVPPDFALAGALAQTKLMRVPADRSRLVTSLERRAHEREIAGDWSARARAIYDRRVLPAVDRQIALIEELQPRAGHEAGVWRLPEGEAYYVEALRTSITSDMTADEVHQLGLDQTRELTARAAALFPRIGLSKGTVAERFAALFRDPRYLYPDTDKGRADEITALNELVGTMSKRLPGYFGTLPKAPLEIRRIPPETEGGMSTHYTPATIDGTRPGIYWLNMRDMGEVPFWDMPTTTFHEGVPGHHLQITLQNQADLPDARKLIGFNGYVEGWALYSEQLALEMGFFEGHPAWELGYLHDALLRAGRLVTDTGLHAKRWSREKAVAVLHETDGDPLALCGQEIERYACWPGQACGYMVGKVTMLRLRDKARHALGPHFDLRQFHDAVLLSGSMPLAILENRVDTYISDASRASL